MPAPLQMLALTFRLDADAENRLLAEVDRIEGRGVLRVLDLVFLAVREPALAGFNGKYAALEYGIHDSRLVQRRVERRAQLIENGLQIGRQRA